MDIYRDLMNKGREIFLSPDEEYSAEEIILGVSVNNGINVKKMRAIDKNTFRGFHRKDKSLIGPKELIEEYISLRLPGIINSLREIKSKEGFECLSENITEELREQLSKNVKSYMLKSYNKVRKPIDLLLEHIVSMSEELNICRDMLVPLLNVPLDSYILESNIIFDERSKMELNIKRGMTYQDIESKTQYSKIQDYIQQRAKDLSEQYNMKLYPIYFDLIWNNRFDKVGKNLFKTNP